MSPTDAPAVLSELLAEEKYAALLKQLRPSGDELLFVPKAGAESKLRLLQFDGGRDAKFIFISRNDICVNKYLRAEYLPTPLFQTEPISARVRS